MKQVLMVCPYSKKDVQDAIEEKGQKDVEVISYPARCMAKPLLWDDIEKRVSEHYGKCSYNLIGSYCLREIEKNIKENDDIDININKLDHCFSMHLNDELINHYVENRKYIATTSWISTWKTNFREWGFDPESDKDSVKQLLSETSDSLMILDTQNRDNAKDNIEELSDYLNMPYEVLPVGLSHISENIDNILLSNEIKEQKDSYSERINIANQEVSNYAMSLDLINDLSRMGDEDMIIESSINLLHSIFAPETIFYAIIENDRINKIISIPENIDIDKKEIESLKALNSDYSILDSGNGFALSVESNMEKLGLIVMNNFKFPQYMHEYLNTSLSIKIIFGLAIDNARKFNLILEQNEEISSQNDNLSILNNELENRVRERTKQLSEAFGEVQKSLEKEKQLSNMQSNFVNMISHEYRTPLTIIHTSADLIKRMKDDKISIVDHANKILFSTKDLTRLVNGVFDYSMNMRNKVKANKFDIISMIWGIIDEFSRNEKERIAFESSFEEIIINSDKELVKFIINELVQNSIKFSGDNTSINIDIEKQNDRIDISVKDKGYGIADKYIGHIFEPFYKIECDIGIQKGTGLGLAIALKYANIINSDIKVKSIPGKETTFTFSLPIVTSS